MDLQESARGLVGSFTGLGARAANAGLQTVAGAVQSMLELLDLNAVLGQLDVDAIVRQVDIAALLERVDIDAIMSRVDIAALLERVDINEIVARVDVDALVSETDLGAVIARSTGGVASGAVDLVRRQGVGLDETVARVASRLRPRRLNGAPSGPPGLVARPVNGPAVDPAAT